VRRFVPLTLALLTACASTPAPRAEATSRPAPAVDPDPDPEPEPEPEPDPDPNVGHSLPDDLFACTLLPVADRQLVRRTDQEVNEDDDPLPVRVLNTLRPRLDSLVVPSAEGLCAPRRGEGRVVGHTPVFSEVGERLAGCTRMSSFALANCAPPQWLRYARPRFAITPLPRDGSTDDPRVRALVPDEAAIERFLSERDPDVRADWRRLLRRRQRIGTVTLGAEEVAWVETHWQIGDGPCPTEDVTQGLFLRSPGGEWRRVELSSGLLAGVFHDGDRVVGLDLLGQLVPRGVYHYCGDSGAADCLGAGIAARRGGDAFEVIHRIDWGFTGGQYSFQNDYPPLFRTDIDCMP